MQYALTFLMLRVGWIAALIGTRDYVRRTRQNRQGRADAPVHTVEQALFKDRMAVVIFLAGFLIFAYTILNAPLFAN